MSRNPTNEKPPGGSNPRTEQAFAVFAALPAKERSYAAVAERAGVSLVTVKRWAAAGKWQERVRERDIRVARKAADRTEAGEVDSRTRHAKLVELGLIKLANAIAKGDIRGSFGDLDRLVRLEGFLKGTDRTLPVAEVYRLFDYLLQYIDREIHDPEQRQRIGRALRDALDAAEAAR